MAASQKERRPRSRASIIVVRYKWEGVAYSGWGPHITQTIGRTLYDVNADDRLRPPGQDRGGALLEGV